MRRLTTAITIPILLLGVLVALALGEEGGARSAERVTCSSTTPPRDSLGRPIALTGTWTGSDRRSYSLRQVGSCLWWRGGTTGSNVFFGRVYSSTVVGLWADVRSRSSSTSGELTLLISSENSVLSLRRYTGSVPARSWRKNP
jgi:hypothetical protein